MQTETCLKTLAPFSQLAVPAGNEHTVTEPLSAVKPKLPAIMSTRKEHFCVDKKISQMCEEKGEEEVQTSRSC